MSINSFNLKSNLVCITFLAILIGIFAALDLPFILALALAVYVIYVCRKDAIGQDESRFITNVCLLAIGMRVLISIFLLWASWHSGVGSDALGDARPYEGVGAYIKEFVTGAPIKTGLWGDNLIHVRWMREVWGELEGRLSGLYSVSMMAYWYAYFYVLWGLDFLAPKIINGLLWVLGAYWLYLFFKERFTKTGIRTGLLITLFLPSAMIFSSSGLKDSLLFFLMIAVIFSSHRLERCNHRWYGVFVLISALLINKLFACTNISVYRISFFPITIFIVSALLVTRSYKYWIFYGPLVISGCILMSTLREHVCSISIVFGLVIMLIRNINFKKVFIGIVLISILVSIILGPKFIYKVDSLLKKSVASSVLQNYNTAIGNTAYRIYPVKYYANPNFATTITYPQLFLSFLNGLRYVFLEPAPWAFRNLNTLLMFPEMLLIWFLMPFIVLGIIAVFRLNRRMALATAVFLFIITSILALGQGNMGTLVRLRMMIMPWYFMFAGLGISVAWANIFKIQKG